MDHDVSYGCPRCFIFPQGNLSEEKRLTEDVNPSNGYSAIPSTNNDGKIKSGELSPLPLYSIKVFTEIQMNVAVVVISATFINTSNSDTVKGVFCFPTMNSKIGVSSCTINYSDKAFSTVLMDAEDTKFPNNPPLDADYHRAQEINPGLFSHSKSFFMPFHSCPPESDIVVDLRYTCDLTFDADSGDYDLVIPLKIPSDQPIYNNYTPESITSIIVRLYPGSLDGPHCRYGSKSHFLSTLPSNPNSVTFFARANSNSNFHVGYHAWVEKVATTCVIQPSDKPGEGTFSMFISPPKSNAYTAAPRTIVFLLDKSGSMEDAPLDTLKAALVDGLSTLSDKDQFAICAFDDHLDWYPNPAEIKFAPVTPARISQATLWLERSVTPGRTTELLKPLQAAIDILSTAFNDNKNIVPTIVLITDGSFQNEYTICSLIQTTNSLDDNAQEAPAYVEELVDPSKRDAISAPKRLKSAKRFFVRIHCLGVGPFVNQIFLKQLAYLGRGQCEIGLSLNVLRKLFVNMMKRVAKPVLMSVAMNLSGITYHTVYPEAERIPDITVGNPILLCGSYEGGNPTSAVISCFLADGTEAVLKTKVSFVPSELSLSSLVARRKIEYLIGKLWIEYDNSNASSQSYGAVGSSVYVKSQQAKKKKKKSLRTEIVQASLTSMYPTIFTTTLAFEDRTFRVQDSSRRIIFNSDTEMYPPPAPIETFPGNDWQRNFLYGGLSNVQLSVNSTFSNKRASLRELLTFDSAILLETDIPVSFYLGSVRATLTNVRTSKAFEVLENDGFSAEPFESIGCFFNRFEGFVDHTLNPVKDITTESESSGGTKEKKASRKRNSDPVNTPENKKPPRGRRDFRDSTESGTTRGREFSRPDYAGYFCGACLNSCIRVSRRTFLRPFQSIECCNRFCNGVTYIVKILCCGHNDEDS